MLKLRAFAKICIIKLQVFAKALILLCFHNPNGWMPSKGGYGCVPITRFPKDGRLRHPRCPNIGATGCGFLLPSSWILPM